MSKRSFQLQPIDSVEADRLRSLDGPRYTADEQPGYPCRQCLRDANVGDELVLVSYDPFRSASPYRAASPVFLHVQPCVFVPLGIEEVLPVQLTCRTLSVRCFDDQAMMTDAALVDGRELESTLDRFFLATNTVYVDVHNAVRGCWAVRVNHADRNPVLTV